MSRFTFLANVSIVKYSCEHFHLGMLSLRSIFGLDKIDAERRSIFAGSWAGWIMDSYDLSMMFLLIVPMSQVFFPSGQGQLAIIQTLSTYLITFLFRPVGGLIFGSLGDRIGRKRSMIITLIGLGVSVFLTGLIPTFAQIGLVAVGLLVMMRALTGIFAGGEYGNSVAILMESVPVQVRGRIGGILHGGYPVGFTLAALTFLSLNLGLTPATFAQFGWRVMFFTGIIPALVGLVLRLKMPESLLWGKLKREEIEKAPIRSLFTKKSYVLAWMSGFLAMAGVSWLYSLTLGFFPTILPRFVNIGYPWSIYIQIAAIVVSFGGYVAAGLIGDYVGRRRTIVLFVILGLLSVPATYFMLNVGYSYIIVGTLACLLSFFVIGVYGVMPSYLSEKFPTKIRSTGVNWAFNSGFIVGGWSSVIVLLLGDLVGAGNFYVALSAGIVVGELFLLASALLSKETSKINLESLA